MRSFSGYDAETSFESALIDLDRVPLPVLRTLDSKELHEAMQHAVLLSGCPSLTEATCSNAGRVE